MQIANKIIEELIKDAGKARETKARIYKNQRRVEITKVEYEDKNNFEVSALVSGNEVYNTYIEVKKGEIEDISCTCQDYYNHYGVCKHTLATIFMLSDTQNEKETQEETNNLFKIYEENNPFEIEKIQNQKEETINVEKNLIGENFTKSKENAKYREFKQIVKSFYNEEINEIENIDEEKIQNEGTIIIEPKIIYDKFTNSLKVEFKLGDKRLYKIKNLTQFYDRMIKKEFYKYGDKLKFIHQKEIFKKESQELLEFIMKYAEIIKETNSTANSNYRYYGNALSESSIMLGANGIDELFEILKDQKVKFQKDYTEQEVEFLDKDPKIEFVLNKTGKKEYEISTNIEIFKINQIQGKKYNYILMENKLYRCTKEFEKSKLKLLKKFRENYITKIYLQEQDLKDLFSIIMPRINNVIKLGNVEETKIDKYKPKTLRIKVFLDFDKRDYLIADLRFIYGENEFNPLDEKKKIEFPRNMVEETKTLNIFRKSGFMVDLQNLRFIMPTNDKIFKFLNEDIEYYMQKFEIMATENFKSKEITKPKIGAIGVKIENDLLKIDLSKINIEAKELEEIMARYKLKKKYYRLRDGSFLKLEENKEIEFVDKLISGTDIEYKELEKGEVKLPVNRSLYLNQLLKELKGTEITKNKEYQKIVNNLEQKQAEEEINIPTNLKANLRYYQKTGFKWLKILDSYKLGGILADDMGLGKTIQILALILSEKEENQKQIEKNNQEQTEKSNQEQTEKSNQDQNTEQIKNANPKSQTSIVISPSSLTLNWLSEAKKFAPDLKVEAIRGNLQERKNKIKNLEKYDLIITSYDLLKRDIEFYKQKDYIFKFAIADEAQYLKNSNTQNAKAIKQIKATTNFALTGTPIENSLSELWSIFDFIMPGYLFTYKKFKSSYEMPIVKDNNKEAMSKLKMLIEPFILRRTKKEVLTELPEKTITVLNNEMDEEQKQIYISYLARVKKEVAEEININGFEKSQIKILAALTRLRQICCHPKLFIENYQGRCSKLEQCMEIIEDAVESGHKILLFSTYTSMFEILEEELRTRKIKYFELTGSTKVEERISLVEEFNKNTEIKIFLVSLKAGGTGLNLTGADMVIHYDPWWNLSAENQATDRAYRIGQKNNVQVYKLITKESIEEKIYELQERKAKLMDDMLSTKTTFINKLSKEDIMRLFE